MESLPLLSTSNEVKGKDEVHIPSGDGYEKPMFDLIMLLTLVYI